MTPKKPRPLPPKTPESDAAFAKKSQELDAAMSRSFAAASAKDEQTPKAYEKDTGIVFPDGDDCLDEGGPKLKEE